MSRSKRKTPIISWTTSGSHAGVQSSYRTKENRKKRRHTKVLMQMENYEDMPHEKKYGNEWSSPRDGKQRIEPDSIYMRK